MPHSRAPSYLRRVGLGPRRKWDFPEVSVCSPKQSLQLGKRVLRCCHSEDALRQGAVLCVRPADTWWLLRLGHTHIGNFGSEKLRHSGERCAVGSLRRTIQRNCSTFQRIRHGAEARALSKSSGSPMRAAELRRTAARYSFESLGCRIKALCGHKACIRKRWCVRVAARVRLRAPACSHSHTVRHSADTCTHTHAKLVLHAHARNHAHAHAHAYATTHPHACMQTCTREHTGKRKRARTRTRMHTHAHAHAHAHACTHATTHPHACMHACRRAHTRTHARKQKVAHTRPCTRARTGMHTYAHARACRHTVALYGSEAHASR
jgi:hypothetical protein